VKLKVGEAMKRFRKVKVGDKVEAGQMLALMDPALAVDHIDEALVGAGGENRGWRDHQPGRTFQPRRRDPRGSHQAGAQPRIGRQRNLGGEGAAALVRTAADFDHLAGQDNPGQRVEAHLGGNAGAQTHRVAIG